MWQLPSGASRSGIRFCCARCELAYASASSAGDGSIVHLLRHTFGSLLIQQGESLAYVKEQMGHASIQITVDVYGHLVPGGNRSAVDRLDSRATNGNPAATSADLALAVNSRKSFDLDPRWTPKTGH